MHPVPKACWQAPEQCWGAVAVLGTAARGAFGEIFGARSGEGSVVNRRNERRRVEEREVTYPHVPPSLETVMEGVEMGDMWDFAKVHELG